MNCLHKSWLCERACTPLTQCKDRIMTRRYECGLNKCERLVQPPPPPTPMRPTAQTPPCSHPLCSWFTAHRVQQKKKERKKQQCSWLCGEVRRHMTGSGRCPAIQTDINGFLFLLSLATPPLTKTTAPQPTSFHPCFHLLFFPFFSPYLFPLSRHPGSHAPLAWPRLTFPSSVYSHVRVPAHTHVLSHTHLPVSHRTFAGLYTCSVQRQTRPRPWRS